MRHLLLAARKAARRFWNARGGNVALMFAIALVPVTVATGGLVDYSRAWVARTTLRAASDATALMLSQQASNLTTAQMSQQATAFFLANYHYNDSLPVTVTPTYSASGPSVTVTASTSVKSYFLNLIGLHRFPVSVSSMVVWGQSRLRVALVLDNTGSMAQSGKIGALQTATHNLLTQLQNAGTNAGDVYVSIIPFNNDVNVGASTYNASWLDFTDWDAANGSNVQTCSGGGGNRGGHNRGGGSRQTCTTTWTPDSHTTWNGCVTDRGTSSAPGTSPGPDQTVYGPGSTTAFPADQSSSCPLAIRGLTDDWSALNTLVDNMTALGSTNQPIGLAWGWQSLVGGGPLTAPALDSQYQYRQVIILLSDGLNTQDRWYGNGSNTSTQVDDRMYNGSDSSAAGTCQNAKATGVEIYSIQVDTGNDPTSTLLQHCASDSSHFFLLTSADQIVTTFSSIGTALSQLRISR